MYWSDEIMRMSARLSENLERELYGLPPIPPKNSSHSTPVTADSQQDGVGIQERWSQYVDLWLQRKRITNNGSIVELERP